MRLFTCLIITGFLLFQPALAKPNNSQDSELTEQGDYINSDGQSVHKPAHSKSGNVPEGASAQCRDGTYSFSTHHRGTCSRHGGVAQWLE